MSTVSDKCKICGVDSGFNGQLCTECNKRIEDIKQSIEVSKARVKRANVICLIKNNESEESLNMKKQGILRLKQDGGGYRHYIELQNGHEKDIHCGELLEVQLGRYADDWGRLEHGPWIGGRYESNLRSDNPTAMLILGELYPTGETMSCKLPLGATVRKPKK